MTTVKIRALYADAANWTSLVYFPFPAIISTTTGSGSLIGLQRTQSDGHRWPPKKRNSQDLGGEFLSQKIVIDPGGVMVNTPPRTTSKKEPVPGNTAWSASGKVYPFFNNYVARITDFLPPSTDAQLDAIGTKLISMALPTNPLSGMGQFLGELKKDGMPSLPSIRKWQAAAESFRAFSKHGSKEYLNAQFGWAPFVRDIIDFAQVCMNLSKHIREYAANSGRPIRRRRSLPVSQTVTCDTPYTHYGVPAFPLYNYSAPGKLTHTLTTSVEHWFSGSFMFHLPVGHDDLQKLKRYEAYANKLFGTRITPDLIYKLTPWTWLVDWFTTLGPIVRNASAFMNDKLVMQYGYVMERKIQLDQYSLSGVVLSDGRGLSCNQSVTKTTLRRKRATPYGFGLNPQSFSAFQWSIIAALGISKAPRSLAF